MSTTARDRGTFPAPPLPLVLLSWAALAVTVGLAIAGAWKTGIAWDETYHVQRMDNFLDTGWYTLDRDFAGDGPSAPGRTTYVYGPVTMMLLHGWSVLFGVDGSDGVATTMYAFSVRHLGVVLIGLVGFAAAAGITRLILGSWRWALVTAAILGAVPLWTGHLMFNLKDVPVATGCTLITLALVWSARATGDRLAVRGARIACLVAGCTLAIGTRPGIWTAVAAGLGTYAALVLVSRWRGEGTAADRPALSGLLDAAIGLVLAAGLLLLAYPKVFSTPVKALRRSAESSSRFREGAESDRLYLPEHLGLSVPLVLVALWLLGSAIGLVWLLRTREDPARAIRVAVVGVQAFTLPTLAILLDSDLYNGLRQMLFVAPACAVLATIGLAWVLAVLRDRVVLRRVAVAGFALLGLAGPVLDQAILFPYGYTYANASADLLRTGTESDYWRTSVRELVPSIPHDGQVVCSPVMLPNGNAMRQAADGSIDCRLSPIGPLATPWTDQGLPVDYSIPDGDFYAVVERGRPAPPNCEPIDRVTRWRHGRTITMSLVARCRLRAPRIPGAGIDLDGSTRSWEFAVRGWETGVINGGLASYGDSASVAFRTPARCATGCRAVLDASVPEDLIVSAGGRDLPWGRLSPRRVGFDLPAVVIAAAGDDGVWVTFTRPAATDLQMNLRGLRVLLAQ